ncbi:MAG: hypothetical protein HZC41_24210 [Chloroflexi bacterium]|nr:hypothetical protein [Chloroflexota bacterium]
MDPRVQPGFLGTGASLMSDLSLLAYVLLIAPAMLVGFVFARRRLLRPHHKGVMTTITLVNWVLILYLMLFSYSRGVVPGLSRFTQPAIFLPTIHLLFGGAAQLLATYLVYRMWREDAQVAAARKRGEQDVSRYWFRPAKPLMRTTLGLWLLTVILGVATYFAFYVTPPARAGDPLEATPEATPAVTEAAPAATPEG